MRAGMPTAPQKVPKVPLTAKLATKEQISCGLCYDERQVGLFLGHVSVMDFRRARRISIFIAITATASVDWEKTS